MRLADMLILLANNQQPEPPDPEVKDYDFTVTDATNPSNNIQIDFNKIYTITGKYKLSSEADSVDVTYTRVPDDVSSNIVICRHEFNCFGKFVWSFVAAEQMTGLLFPYINDDTAEYPWDVQIASNEYWYDDVTFNNNPEHPRYKYKLNIVQA